MIVDAVVVVVVAVTVITVVEVERANEGGRSVGELGGVLSVKGSVVKKESRKLALKSSLAARHSTSPLSALLENRPIILYIRQII